MDLLAPALRAFGYAEFLSRLPQALQSAPARRPLLDAAPAVADGLGEQISLSKDVNSACATGRFTQALLKEARKA